MATKYTKGSIKASDVDDEDLESMDFAVDTAGSWDGEFPRIGKGDFIVILGAHDRDEDTVLVSRRYTGAIDHDNAAELALSAYAERHDYETDDEGNVIPIEDEHGMNGGEKFIPCWVQEVKKVS